MCQDGDGRKRYPTNFRRVSNAAIGLKSVGLVDCQFRNQCGCDLTPSLWQCAVQQEVVQGYCRGFQNLDSSSSQSTSVVMPSEEPFPAFNFQMVFLKVSTEICRGCVPFSRSLCHSAIHSALANSSFSRCSGANSYTLELQSKNCCDASPRGDLFIWLVRRLAKFLFRLQV